MANFYANNHQCATCEYWDGPRKVTRDPTFVECPSRQTKGVCCGNGKMRGKSVDASATYGRDPMHFGDCHRLWRYLQEGRW